ncbi:MAG: hypothetical protein IPK60_10250 [Sandaracinaceae bacterium]|nr:hypothetical protein [Sandaracinaceae bacterium]
MSERAALPERASPTYAAQPQAAPVVQRPVRLAYVSDDQRIADAIVHASPGARRVLEMARTMINDVTIVRGSCWDWVHEVYTRARGDTERVFGSRLTGPFGDTALIEPGDWIYLNHVEGGGTHSAIFVAWADEPSRVALMVSYAGGRSNTPGRFGQYDLSAVYRIMRLSDSEVTPPPPRRQHRHHSQ